MCSVNAYLQLRYFFLSNFTYGYLVMKLRFGETVIVTLREEGKTNLVG